VAASANPGTSLNAVTGDGAGTALSFEAVLHRHTMVVSYTGTPSSVRVNLEGSLDGTVWAVLDEFDYASSSASARTVIASVAYVRANLVSHFGNLTLTAKIASA
jgi:hypothetical protein